MRPPSYLSAEHCQSLDCALRKIAETQELVDKCTNCGLDTQAAQEELQRQRNLATLLKAEFYPHNP